MKTNWFAISSSVLIAYLINIVSGLTPSKLNFTPKTIHISSTAGGLSHIAWTLEIGKVLAERGHNVSFITSDLFVKFGLPYEPHIKTISMGPYNSKFQLRDIFDTENPFSASSLNTYATLVEDVYKGEYYAYKNIFASSNTSLAICDQMSLSCFDAAKALNIPMVLHMTPSLSEDTTAPFIADAIISEEPTTLDQSLIQRLYHRYIFVPKVLYRYRKVLRAVKRARQEINVNDFNPMSRHSNVIKMINSFWGMDSPRPVGPLVEYVGPIIGTTYASLSEELFQFMEQHQRVVYVAFGQTYNPNKQEFGVLLTSLMEAYELNYLDGFIWSLSIKSRNDLPEKIRTRSGTTYSVQELLKGDQFSDIRFDTWSPQFAILDHAHCKLFISHGGASSIHESLYNGVPLLLHPFASDQPSNAFNMAQAGVGLVLDRKKHNVSDVFHKLSTILADHDGTFALNMKSMQALAQLSSRRKYYAADMIEEVMYSVRNKTEIWNRREVSADMPWYKATNWDVDLCALSGAVIFVVMMCKILNKLSISFKTLLISPRKRKTA